MLDDKPSTNIEAMYAAEIKIKSLKYMILKDSTRLKKVSNKK